MLIFNGDIVDDHDITAQVARHEAARANAALYLTRVDDPRAYGCVPTDEAGWVTAFLEKTPEPVRNQINAGCYVWCWDASRTRTGATSAPRSRTCRAPRLLQSSPRASVSQAGFEGCEASDLRVGTVQTETLEQTSGCAVKRPGS